MRLGNAFRRAALILPPAGVLLTAAAETGYKILPLLALTFSYAVGYIYEHRSHAAAKTRERENSRQSPASGDLQDVFHELCDRYAMPRTQLYVLEGSGSNNAGVTFWHTWIGKDLAEGLTGPEIKFVLAHELSHRKKGHAVYGDFFARIKHASIAFVYAIGGLQVFNLAADLFDMDLSKPVAAPVLALATGLSMMFGASALSRRIEYQTDRAALGVTHDIEGATSFFRRLGPAARRSLFDSHPTPEKRIKALEKYAAENLSLTGFPSLPLFR